MRSFFLVPAALLCVLGTACNSKNDPTVPEFSLADRNGKVVTDRRLRGKVWVVSFVFTRCSRCPQITQTMRDLQDRFGDHPEFRLVSFTVDPEHDDAETLKAYAEQYNADPNRWYFLTGSEDDLYKLFREGFKVHVEQRTGAARRLGQQVDHDTHVYLIDRAGRIRKRAWGLPPTFDDKEANSAAREQLEKDQEELRAEIDKQLGPNVHFPTVNAMLNGLSGVLILFGITAVKLRRIRLHKICMIVALLVSILFLASYLYYHIVVKQGASTRFADQAPQATTWVAWTYRVILLSHTILAAIVAPLALRVAYLGIREQLPKHVKLARVTWPIWLYVSVTGVVVYWMLYQLYPGV